MTDDVIETERLRLRPFAEDLSDLDALSEIQSDPHHMRFYPHPFSREESRAWIEKFIERQERYGYSLWAIEDRETGSSWAIAAPCRSGSTGSMRSRSAGRSRNTARARIATEAAAAWRDRCLGPLGMEHVISLIRPENVPSRGVAERIGMTVWKETLHGAERWLHLVYRIDREPR